MRRYSTILLSIFAMSGCMMQDISDTKGEVKKSNKNMETLIGLSKSAESKLDVSIAEVQKSNANMETLISLSKSADRQLTDSIELQKALKKLTGDTYTEVKRTREATEDTLANVRKQKRSVLDERLSAFMDVAKNPAVSNSSRVTNAAALYHLLIDEELGPEMYVKAVASHFDMCRKEDDADAKVCTALKYPPTAASTPPADESAETPYRTNFVLALALTPEFVDKFYEHVVSAKSSAVSEQATEFLLVGRKMLAKTLAQLAESEGKGGKLLKTYQLEQFRGRRTVITKTLGLDTTFQDEALKEEVKGTTEKLLKAVAQRKPDELSEEDKEILGEIQSDS